MKMSILKDQEIERSEGWYLILFPATSFRRIILVGLGVAMAQQVVGIDSIQYFLISILEDSGIQSSSGQKWVLIVLGCFRLVFIIIGGRLLDQKGRKPLIFISLAGESYRVDSMIQNLILVFFLTGEFISLDLLCLCRLRSSTSAPLL